MAVLNMMKGKCTIQELIELPNRIFHQLYYRHYLMATDKDNNGRKQIENEEIMDELEDAAEKGIL